MSRDSDKYAALFRVAASVPKPKEFTGDQREYFRRRITEFLEQKDAVLIAHYYVDSELQELANETGGHVADSLEMARFGHEHPAKTLIVAGVRFMGETAKILNPEKRVLMVDNDAECSLDISCPIEEFTSYCDAHPDRTVVVYANTSAEVKARADWTVTSGIALPIIEHLHKQGEKIIWAPDRHLGAWVQKKTGANMLLWKGICVVHDEFRANELVKLKELYPDAKILVHPESPQAIIDMADVVGSTTGMIQAVKSLDSKRFIVATDRGIFHKMHEAAEGKELIEAPTHGVGATCVSCGHCPWMALNDLEKLATVLETGADEIEVDEKVRAEAVHSINRMLAFARQREIDMRERGNA